MKQFYDNRTLAFLVLSFSLLTGSLYSMEKKENHDIMLSLVNLATNKLQSMDFFPIENPEPLFQFIAPDYNIPNSNMKTACKYFRIKILPTLANKPLAKKYQIVNSYLSTLDRNEEIHLFKKSLIFLLVKYIEAQKHKKTYFCCKSPTIHCVTFNLGCTSIFRVLEANRNNLSPSLCPYYFFFLKELADKESQPTLTYFIENIYPEYCEHLNEVYQDRGLNLVTAVQTLKSASEKVTDRTEEFQVNLTDLIIRFFSTITIKQMESISHFRLLNGDVHNRIIDYNNRYSLGSLFITIMNDKFNTTL